MEADPDVRPDCGIVQYETNETALSPTVRCIGKITRAQVTESEWVVYSLWSRVCVCVCVCGFDMLCLVPKATFMSHVQYMSL